MAPAYWSCDCCCEGFRDYTSIDIDGSPVCVPCVRKMFDKALEFEHEYPPHWAGPLHPSEFNHIFSADYIERYKQREIEYKTPITKRIYCQHDITSKQPQSNGEVKTVVGRCGGFIGSRRGPSQPEILTLGRCNSCKRATCMVCDDYSEDPLHLLSHDCPGKSHANEDRAKAFIGLKRGKDWQQCPSRQCGRRIELSAACNHMTCQCGKGFCFICGKEADGESDHWRKGGCPRYNQPGDANVEYDDGYEDDDDDSSLADTDVDHDTDPVEYVRGLFENEEGGHGEGSLGVVEELAQMPLPPIFLAREAISGETAYALGTFLEVEEEVTPSQPSSGSTPVTPPSQELNTPDSQDAVAIAQGSTPSTPPPLELYTPDARDAEAIAQLYLQDDWSNEGGFEHRLLSGESVPEAMTVDEVEMDHALWRMRMD